ncbi:MAG: hypothetical protein QME96_17410, partial [Myxococcota bacterium]|nr:hypothetical protein [Myxococcota bacterium]
SDVVRGHVGPPFLVSSAPLGSPASCDAASGKPRAWKGTRRLLKACRAFCTSRARYALRSR